MMTSGLPFLSTLSPGNVDENVANRLGRGGLRIALLDLIQNLYYVTHAHEPDHQRTS